MKAIIFDWAGACKDELKVLGYTHQMEFEDLSAEHFWLMVQVISDSGMDVMVTKSGDGKSKMICVDKQGKKFKQR